MHPPTAYPHLAGLLAGWFHQDFDVAGSTLDEVVAAYRATADAAERLAVRDDIQRFILQHASSTSDPTLGSSLGSSLGSALDATFQLEVDPLGFADSAQDFLQRIDRALAAD